MICFQLKIIYLTQFLQFRLHQLACYSNKPNSPTLQILEDTNMHRPFHLASKKYPVGLSLSNFSVFKNERSLHIKEVIMLLQQFWGSPSDG